MCPEITPLEKTILLAAAADLDRLRRGKSVPGINGWHALENAKADAAAGLVRLATARWLGFETLTPAARMAATRAIRRLEQRGLAERSIEGWAQERANYLRITNAGRKLAKELRKAEAAADG
jgi:hypothetical protein